MKCKICDGRGSYTTPIDTTYDCPECTDTHAVQDKTPTLVNKCPTAAELNEMGVSCGTCNHFHGQGSTGHSGICFFGEGMGGEFGDVDASWFCSEHPKLRGEL